MPKFRNLWEHIRTQDAQEGPRQGRDASTRSSLPVELQTALEALYGHYEKTFELWEKARHRGAALFHHRLQQHLHLQAGLRLHLRVSARERGWHQPTGQRPPGAVPQLSTSTATRSRAPHPADRQRAAGIRRGAGQELPRAWPPTRSSASGARSSSAPAIRRQAENLTDQDLLREVMNTVGKAGRLGDRHPLRGLGLHAHRRLGRQHRHPRAGRARLRHPAALRAGHRPRPAPPVLRPERRRAVQRRIRRRPGHPL